MPRQEFDKALAELQRDILCMGALVEKSVFESVQALINQDTALAARVIMNDERVDELYREVEDNCIKLIAIQQPMAKDLRVVITGIKILQNLERMADYSVDIARATMCLTGLPFNFNEKAINEIPHMGRLAQQMLKDGLDAYVQGDVEKARDMCAMDDQVDYIYDYIFRELSASMRENNDAITQGTHLMYVSRHLERIADHATNIGEAVIYQVTGERKELN